jgi:hypothetical protein
MAYSLSTHNLNLPVPNNANGLQLTLTEDSGSIVTRRKINTVIGVDHPGIVLGMDQNGYKWVAHHHYKNTYPTIDRIDVYADGNEVRYDDQPVSFTQRQILERALMYWWNGPQYTLFQNNCQHFVSIVVRDERFSQGIEKGSDMAIFGGALMMLGGLLAKNKGVMAFGGMMMAAGGIGKATNRTSDSPQLPWGSKYQLQ